MNITIRQNLYKNAISQYSNYFFSRGIKKIGGKYIALNCKSLCQLGGDTDNTQIIESEIRTGATPFVDGRKRVRTFHVRGQFNSTAAIVLNYEMDSSDSSLLAEKAITGIVGSSGSSLKFNGKRSIYGDYLCVQLKNKLNEFFHIDDISAVTIDGRRL